MKFFVRLTLVIGSCEKTSKHIIDASDSLQAGTGALINECHGEPNWCDDPILKQLVWDMHEMAYKVSEVKLLTKSEYEVLSRFI